MDDKEKEKAIWKQYPDYSFIEVSNLGMVRTKDRIVICSDGKRKFVKGRVLKQQLHKNGYMYVAFGVNGKSFCLRVSRMVASRFVPNPDNLPEVNHIDCDRTNNRWDNLEWCTHQENIAYRDKLGHTAKHNHPKKSVIAVNSETSEVFWFESQREAGRQLRVNQSDITKVVKDKKYKASGYWFCYADENAVEKVRSKFGDEVAEKVEKLINKKLNFF